MPLEDYSGNFKTVTLPYTVLQEDLTMTTMMPFLYPNGNYRPAGYNPKTESCCPNTEMAPPEGDPVGIPVIMPFFDPRTYMCYAVCPASLPNLLTLECCPTSMPNYNVVTMACEPCPAGEVYIPNVDPTLEGACGTP